MHTQKFKLLLQAIACLPVVSGAFHAAPCHGQEYPIGVWSLTSTGAPREDSLSIPSAFTASKLDLKFSPDGAWANNWPSGFDAETYFQIQIKAPAAYPIIVREINFKERKSNTGIQKYEVHYSLDGFQTSTPLAVVERPEDEGTRTGDLLNLSIQVPSGQVLTIRWFGYGATHKGGTWRIEANTLNVVGEVVGAPFIHSPVDSIYLGSIPIGRAFVSTAEFKADRLVAPLKLMGNLTFDLSLDNEEWHPILALNPASDATINENVFIRFSPSEKGLVKDSLIVVSKDANIRKIKLSGRGIDPSINQESFQNIVGTVGYKDHYWTGDNGGEWSATNALTIEKIEGKKAITLQNGILTSALILGNIKSVSVTTQAVIKERPTGVLQLKINGTLIGEIPYSEEIQTTTLPDIDFAGDATITLETTQEGHRVSIGHMSWTGFSLDLPTAYFEAEKNAHYIHVKWGAGNDHDFNYFSVERSIDGNSFQEIGRVFPTNAQERNFEFHDLPPPHLRRLFYRLKMVEFDGDEKYSEIAMVHMGNDVANLFLKSNLVEDDILIHLSGERLQYLICDLTGKSYLSGERDVSGLQEIQLEASMLSSGMYLLHVELDNDHHTFKFIKN